MNLSQRQLRNLRSTINVTLGAAEKREKAEIPGMDLFLQYSAPAAAAPGPDFSAFLSQALWGRGIWEQIRPILESEESLFKPRATRIQTVGIAVTSTQQFYPQYVYFATPGAVDVMLPWNSKGSTITVNQGHVSGQISHPCHGDFPEQWEVIKKMAAVDAQAAVLKAKWAQHANIVIAYVQAAATFREAATTWPAVRYAMKGVESRRRGPDTTPQPYKRGLKGLQERHAELWQIATSHLTNVDQDAITADIVTYGIFGENKS